MYCFSPHPFKGKQRRDVNRWRGPGTVIAKENENGTRYYVAWRSKVLLVATTQTRLATPEENSAAVIAQDANLTAQKLDKEGTVGYRDATFKTDYWNCSGDSWTRYHVLPRTLQYIPEETPEGPDLNLLEDIAEIRADFQDGTCREFEFNWRNQQAKDLAMPWTGETRFRLRSISERPVKRIRKTINKHQLVMRARAKQRAKEERAITTDVQEEKRAEVPALLPPPAEPPKNEAQESTEPVGKAEAVEAEVLPTDCLLYTSPSPRDS